MPPATATTTLFSLATVKAWLKLGTDEHSLDAALVTVADAITARIEQATGWMFVTRTVTETWDGNDRDVRYLRPRPIASVSALTVDNTVIDPTGYVIEGRTGRLALLTQAFTKGRGNCAATAVAGFDVQDGPALPQDIVLAGLNWLKADYDEKTSGAIAASSISIGAATMVLKPGLPPAIAKTLTNWKDTRG